MTTVTGKCIVSAIIRWIIQKMEDVFQQAEQLFEEQQHEYAIFLLSDVIESSDYDEKAEALCKRSACYMHMNRYRDACNDLMKAIELDRTKPHAYVRQSKCYLALGDLDNAICSLNTLRSIDPDDSFARYELEKLKTLKEYDIKAKKLFEQEHHADVVKLMDKCLEKAAICIKFKLLKAECLVYLRKHEQVVVIVNEVLFMHKDDIEAICIRAMNLLHQEKYQLGMIELKEVLTISPKATQMFKNYKAIAEKMKKAEKAFLTNKLDETCTLYEQILRIDMKNTTKNFRIHIKLAELCQKQQKCEDAIEHCTKALKIQNSGTALKIRAECNFQLKDYDVCVEDYKALIKLEDKPCNNLKLQDAQRLLSWEDNDSYKLLGVPNTATADEIKKAYRKLAREIHPDKHSEKSDYTQHKLKTRFSRIQQAHSKLMTIHSPII